MSTAESTAPDPIEVVIGEHSLDAAQGANRAHIGWTDSDATLDYEGVSSVFVRADAAGTWKVVEPEEPRFAGAASLLAAVEDRAHDENIVLPWRHPAASQNLDCQTISTWVFGSSCSACWDAANSQVYYGSAYDVSNRTCSSGSVYTTCGLKACLRYSEEQESE